MDNEFYFLDNAQISEIQIWLNFLSDLYEYGVAKEIKEILGKSVLEKKISKADCLRLIELLENSNFEYQEQEDDSNKTEKIVTSNPLITYKRNILEFHNLLVYWLFMNSEQKTQSQRKYRGIFQNFIL